MRRTVFHCFMSYESSTSIEKRPLTALDPTMPLHCVPEEGPYDDKDRFQLFHIRQEQYDNQ